MALFKDLTDTVKCFTKGEVVVLRKVWTRLFLSWLPFFFKNGYLVLAILPISDILLWHFSQFSLRRLLIYRLTFFAFLQSVLFLMLILSFVILFKTIDIGQMSPGYPKNLISCIFFALILLHKRVFFITTQIELRPFISSESLLFQAYKVSNAIETMFLSLMIVCFLNNRFLFQTFVSSFFILIETGGLIYGMLKCERLWPLPRIDQTWDIFRKFVIPLALVLELISIFIR